MCSIYGMSNCEAITYTKGLTVWLMNMCDQPTSRTRNRPVPITCDIVQSSHKSWNPKYFLNFMWVLWHFQTKSLFAQISGRLVISPWFLPIHKKIWANQNASLKATWSHSFHSLVRCVWSWSRKVNKGGMSWSRSYLPKYQEANVLVASQGQTWTQMKHSKICLDQDHFL